jgi:hypothetical protein
MMNTIRMVHGKVSIVDDWKGARSATMVELDGQPKIRKRAILENAIFVNLQLWLDYNTGWR